MSHESGVMRHLKPKNQENIINNTLIV